MKSLLLLSSCVLATSCAWGSVVPVAKATQRMDSAASGAGFATVVITAVGVCLVVCLLEKLIAQAKRLWH